MSTRICVVGCGAVGGLFAAHLAQLDDVQVFAYDLAKDHVAAINTSGLRLTGKADLVGRIHATCNPGEIPPCDFGIVATKGYATRAAISSAAACFPKSASVCSVQNGVGNEEIIAAYVENVMRGTTFPAGHLVEPGVVEMDTTGDTWIGPYEERPAAMAEIRRLAELLTLAGMTTVALEDARGAQWTKLIFNAATNPIGALTNLTHGQVCELPAVRALVRELVAEGVAVAGALGIELESDPEELIDHAARVAYDHRASMLQDVLARRRTEIDSLNGGIVAYAEKCAVGAPLNRAVAALIKGLESSFAASSSKGEAPS